MGNEVTRTIFIRQKIHHTDHQVWLKNVKDPSSKLMRWRLRLEEYEFEIEYKKGKENKSLMHYHAISFLFIQSK